MRRTLAVLLTLAVWLLPGCSQEPPPQSKTYRDPKSGISFNPAPGWTVAEKKEEGCDFAVEAAKGPDLRFLICLSRPRPDILFTQNAYVSCENIKQYIQESLKGVRPTCSKGGSATLFGYDALYARLLHSEGKLRVQFVDHLFVPSKGRLVQVMAYSVGDDDNAAHELFDDNRMAFFTMMSSVRLHRRWP